MHIHLLLTLKEYKKMFHLCGWMFYPDIVAKVYNNLFKKRECTFMQNILILIV